MGDPKRLRRAYETPRKGFQKERITKVKEVKKEYGLKNEREYLKAESTIRNKRATARKLLALDLETRLKREKELLDSLIRIGILHGKPTLEDVLTLSPESWVERRLQTIVWRKGLANTAKQSRQFIVHGHISINGKKVDRPGYIVSKDDEGKIAYHKKEMILEQKQKLGRVKEDAKKEIADAFEEAKGSEEVTEETKEVKKEHKIKEDAKE